MTGSCTSLIGQTLIQRLRDPEIDHFGLDVAAVEAADVIEEQRRTIECLMIGMPDDTTTPVIRRIAALELEIEALRAALAELVTLNNTTASLPVWPFSPDPDVETRRDCDRRQPLAWAAARKALGVAP